MRAIIVHGGAGRWTDERLKDAIPVLREAASVGFRYLEKGDPLGAVEEAVKVLEDSPHFNAGRGSVLSIDGSLEMDACIVRDRPKLIGSVIGVRRVKNPISLARLVAEKTSHHIMYGEGAERLARLFGLPEGELITERARKRLERLREKLLRGELGEYAKLMEKTAELIRRYPELFIGTVGAVATDGEVVVAGTSTGGTSLKLPGRVGDTPIPGAGTWAEKGCGASATGVGEGIIQILMTKTLCDLYDRGHGLREAAERVVSMTDYPVGVIALSTEGEVSLAYNTEYMPVAIKVEKKEVEIHGVQRESSRP
ncbi:MAG: asparaginase [Thermotogae bacterium]|nr:asparaginase [Thermotogota bacterium]